MASPALLDELHNTLPWHASTNAVSPDFQRGSPHKRLEVYLTENQFNCIPEKKNRQHNLNTAHNLAYAEFAKKRLGLSPSIMATQELVGDWYRL